MDRTGFIILSVLKHGGALCRLSAMTVHEIALAENLGIKENTIFKKIRGFEQSGYVGRGLKEGRECTFFITEAGTGILEKERMLL